MSNGNCHHLTTLLTLCKRFPLVINAHYRSSWLRKLLNVTKKHPVALFMIWLWIEDKISQLEQRVHTHVDYHVNPAKGFSGTPLQLVTGKLWTYLKKPLMFAEWLQLKISCTSSKWKVLIFTRQQESSRFGVV